MQATVAAFSIAMTCWLPAQEAVNWRYEMQKRVRDYPEDLTALLSMPDKVQDRVDRAFEQLANDEGVGAVMDVVTGENYLARAVVGSRLIEVEAVPDSLLSKLFRDKKRIVRYVTLKAYLEKADYKPGLIEPLVTDKGDYISYSATLAVLERQPARAAELLPGLVASRDIFDDIYESIGQADRLKVRAKVRTLRNSRNAKIRDAAVARCRRMGWYELAEIRELISSPSPRDRSFGCTLVRTAEQARVLEDALKSCLSEQTAVAHTAVHAASRSPLFLPELRDLLNRQDVELQLNLALAIANADPTDRASVNQLATLAQSTASDVAIYALAYLREIADSRVVSCFDKLRPLIVEPKFAAGDAPLNDGEVITEFTILLRKCKKALAPTLSRWLTEPEPVPGFHASVLANFPSPGFLGREVEPDEQLVRSITRHFRSENLAQRDAAITALGVLVDHHNIEGISVPGEHFTLAIQNGNDSLRAIALNALALVTVETPEAIRSSVKDATETKSLDVRIAAARALACLFAADLNVVLPIAREAINSDRPAAVGLIQELGENAGPLLPALMEAIERGHTDDWIEASERWANAFSELSSTDAIGPLVDGLSHKNPDVRRTCATALGHFADSWEAIDALANRIHDVDGGSWPVGEAAIESLIRSNRKLDHIAPRLIALIKSVTREEQPGLYDAAIRLLARIGPPANKALPTLATYDYVTRVRNSDGQWCTHVSKASFETAVATKSIAPTSRLGLVGFRQIIKSVAGGRAWMPLTDRVEDGTLENSRHIGFTLSIDYIVKNDLRELVDELKLPLKTSLLHSDYRAELLFALAMLEPQGDWKIQLKSLAKDGSARAKQRLDHM